jgi:hypothetical protein
MFAILIAPTNLPKLLANHHMTEKYYNYGIKTYLTQKSNNKWYYISGYVDTRGVLKDFAVLPQYILDDNFEYDPIKIKTDWDLIVRK